MTRPKLKQIEHRANHAAGGAPVSGMLVLLATLVIAVAGQSAAAGASSVTLRSEVEAVGPTVTLADIARLRGEYARSLGELAIIEFGDDQQTQRLSMQQVRRKLDQQDVHWGRLVCRGARRVTVHRIDPPEPEPESPAEAASEDQAAAPATVRANPIEPIVADDADPTAPRTLRHRIKTWLIQQVDLGENVDVTFRFDEADAPLLDAPLGSQRLEFEPLGARPIGRVPVTVRRYEGEELAGTERLRVEVAVTQPAVVAKRSLSRGQVITENDLTLKQITLSSLRKQPLREVDSAVGQKADSLIREGAVVHVDDVRAPLLVRRGQTVTVRVIQGGIVLRTVARAMDDGEHGQRITLRNERTRERFEAHVSGPQEAVMTGDDGASVASQEKQE